MILIEPCETLNGATIAGMFIVEICVSAPRTSVGGDTPRERMAEPNANGSAALRSRRMSTTRIGEPDSSAAEIDNPVSVEGDQWLRRKPLPASCSQRISPRL